MKTNTNYTTAMNNTNYTTNGIREFFNRLFIDDYEPKSEYNDEVAAICREVFPKKTTIKISEKNLHNSEKMLTFVSETMEETTMKNTNNTTDMSKKANYTLFYGTEENAFEVERIGDFATESECFDCIRKNLAEDCKYLPESEREEAYNTLCEFITEGGFEGVNNQDYFEMYLILGFGDTEGAEVEFGELRDEFFGDMD